MKLKSITLGSLVLGLALMTASAAQARDLRTRTDTLSSSSARSESGDGGGFSLGMSSYNGVSGSSFAALMPLGHGALQLNFSMPSTSPFTLMAGGLYKYYFMEHNGYGFHAGGGAFLGTTGSFTMAISGVLGFHFPFPGTNNQISFHLDGGPIFTLISGAVATATNFAVSPYSSILGLSAFYTF